MQLVNKNINSWFKGVINQAKTVLLLTLDFQWHKF